MTSMLTDRRLSEFARLLFGWLVYEVDPTCGCLDGLTLVDLAELFGKRDARTIGNALTELRTRGYVTFSFPVGRGTGWVAVTGFYGEVLHPTEWLRRQWAIGKPWRQANEEAGRQEDTR